MKKIMSLFAIIVVISCGSEKTKITGKIENIGEMKTMLYLSMFNKEKKELERVDSVEVSQEKSDFSFILKMEEGTFVVLELLELQMGSQFFLDKGDNFNVKLDFSKNLEIVESSGSKVFEQFSTASKKIQEIKMEINSDNQNLQIAMNDNEEQKIAEIQKKIDENKNLLKIYPYEFAKQNRGSSIIPWVYLYATGLLPELVDEEKLKEIVGELSKEVKESAWGEVLINFTKTLKGSELEDVALYDLEDKKVSLKSFRGKKVYVRFWIRQHAENVLPFIEKIKNEYTDKIEVVLVYLGTEQDKIIWKGLSEEHKILCVNLFADFEIADKYSLQSPFSSFILDEKGIIIDKDLNDVELEEKLKEITL